MDLLKKTFREFLDDEAPRMAAALSYYTIFALPPLLVLLMMMAGSVVDPQDLQGDVERQMSAMMGPDAAGQIRTMVEEAGRPGTGGVFATLLSIGALLFGATGAFSQLQGALNTAWDVKPDPQVSGIRNFLVKRLLSFGMIVGVAFLLLVSLLLSALVSAFGDFVASSIGGGISSALLAVMQEGLSLVVLAGVFAAMFRILPDAKIGWRDVAIGAGVTAVLFVLGKFLIGFYIGRSDPGSAYGAAASLAVVLVWVYYAALILLLGAEFTQVWASRNGRAIEPEEGAISVSPAR